MIILDTCVIRGMKLDSGDAYLLRAIRETGTDRVAVPWMVLEERAAQLAIEYGKAHEKAAQALRQLQKASPLDVPALDDPDPEAVREDLRGRLRELVEVLPTSEEALREGMFREANSLPPAGLKKEIKTGARDVAIWLSAVEYARDHPEEKVYFVSGNTRDFTDGSTTYPAPMDQDVEGLGDRFVHLTSLADLLQLIAPSVEVTPEQVQKLAPSYTGFIRGAALARWGSPRVGLGARFPAVRRMTGLAHHAQGWLTTGDSLRVKAVDVTDVRGSRLGDHEWFTATVQWQFIGVAIFPKALGAGCSLWTTRILMPLVEDGPDPIILSADPPQAPASVEGIEWPADLPGPNERSRELRHLLESITPSTKLERAAALFAYSARGVLDENHEATRRFMEEERYQKIAMDGQADAAAEAAAAEGWNTDDGDDFWDA
ncbi:PIN domain-containing protein (plasmid) [Streptomyces poriferorum]|uniref:PIN domain-containing protein n=1 Tax=Streptomyces poriferorum TaxID=2798799 RepID=UPI00273F76DB|nr:PIN domain-containing protein [Streptomyces sp. Alt1]WLQ53685.1 PIN domain-containing protein [Streptomyces sp. Alt1]